MLCAVSSPEMIQPMTTHTLTSHFSALFTSTRESAVMRCPYKSYLAMLVGLSEQL